MRVVIDTNYFYTLKEVHLAALRARGLVLSVSSMALIEASARSARDARMETLVAPASRLYPYVDLKQPIAQFAGEALKAIIAEERGEPAPLGDVAQYAADWWTALGTRRITAAKWRALAERGCRLRDEFDQNWRTLCRRLDGPEDARWRAERGAESSVRSYVEHAVGVDSVVAQRIDAWLSVIAHRLERTAIGAMTPGTNDARDNRLLVHLGMGHVLLTRDTRFIEAVDACGTYQAPWVRTLPDLLDLPLPEGPPWGERARAQAHAFTRTGRM